MATMTGDDPLLRWRDEFPILQRCTYLISNSLGAMPRAAYDALRQYADEWATEGVTAWHHWLPEQAPSLLANLRACV